MGVGSGGGSRVGERRMELEQRGECGSGREESLVQREAENRGAGSASCCHPGLDQSPERG